MHAICARCLFLPSLGIKLATDNRLKFNTACISGKLICIVMYSNSSLSDDSGAELDTSFLCPCGRTDFPHCLYPPPKCLDNRHALKHTKIPRAGFGTWCCTLSEFILWESSKELCIYQHLITSQMSTY